MLRTPLAGVETGDDLWRIKVSIKAALRFPLPPSRGQDKKEDFLRLETIKMKRSSLRGWHTYSNIAEVWIREVR